MFISHPWYWIICWSQPLLHLEMVTTKFFGGFSINMLNQFSPSTYGSFQACQRQRWRGGPGSSPGCVRRADRQHAAQCADAAGAKGCQWGSGAVGQWGSWIIHQKSKMWGLRWLMNISTWFIQIWDGLTVVQHQLSPFDLASVPILAKWDDLPGLAS